MGLVLRQEIMYYLEIKLELRFLIVKDQLQ